MAGLCVGTCSAVSGFFGMNLLSGVEEVCLRRLVLVMPCPETPPLFYLASAPPRQPANRAVLLPGHIGVTLLPHHPASLPAYHLSTLLPCHAAGGRPLSIRYNRSPATPAAGGRPLPIRNSHSPSTPAAGGGPLSLCNGHVDALRRQPLRRLPPPIPLPLAPAARQAARRAGAQDRAQDNQPLSLYRRLSVTNHCCYTVTATTHRCLTVTIPLRRRSRTCSTIWTPSRCCCAVAPVSPRVRSSECR